MLGIAGKIAQCRSRLRPFLCVVRFNSGYPRLADRAHRQLYNSLQTETKRYRNGNSVKLKPSLPHFFVWLQKAINKEPVALGKAHIPVPFSREAVVEVGLFHLLIGLQGHKIEGWDWNSLMEHLESLSTKMQASNRFADAETSSLADVKRALLLEISERKPNKEQESIIDMSVRVVGSAEPEIYSNPSSTIVTWLQILFASSVTDAERSLRNSEHTPPCIISDFLLRTPMSRMELHSQLKLWESSIGSIGHQYHRKQSHIINIITHLCYYCVHYDPSYIYDLMKHSLRYFTSGASGITYKLFNPQQTNKLLWTLSSFLMQMSVPSSQTSMSIIRAQELLVKHITHQELSQLGFMAIVTSLRLVDVKKAQKLLDHAKAQFPEPIAETHIASIYLSVTTEQLLHNFNLGVSHFESSATLWLAFITKLNEFGLLSEQRSHKILKQLVNRLDRLIISKQIIIMLLQPIKTTSGIEQFIEQLQSARMFNNYRGIIHNRYLHILYQNSDGKSLRKPYLDGICTSSSNLECARLLYSFMKRKTVGNVGVMLAGESTYQAENLYELYQEELGMKSPDENCLVALIKAATKKYLDERRLWWNNFHASQIAVYEFKMNVSETHDDTKIMPSNKTWQLYVTLLRDCDYTAELSEILRWWEQLHFVPERDTLLMLLKALPLPFAQRHIKHWRSVPDSSSSLKDWPWPSEEELTV